MEIAGMVKKQSSCKKIWNKSEWKDFHRIERAAASDRSMDPANIWQKMSFSNVCCFSDMTIKAIYKEPNHDKSYVTTLKDVSGYFIN